MDEKTLIERLSENPESVEEFTRAELEQARTDLKSIGREFVAALKSGESEDKAADLEAAAEAKARLEVVEAKLAEYDAEDAEINEQADELAGSFEEEEEIEAEVVEEIDAEVEVEGELELEVPQDEELAEPEEEKELVTVAASEKPSIGAIAKRAPKPKPEPKPSLAKATASVVAAQAFPQGIRDMGDMAGAFKKVWEDLGPQPTATRGKVVSFDVTDQYQYEVRGEYEHDMGVISELQKELRKIQTPEALTAAASFCAPAQPLYDYFNIAESTGLVSLPTLNASRGRITYRTSPSYQSVNDNTNWSNAAGQVYTAANAEAGASKNTFEIECPSTTTCSVDAFPVILEFTNFTDRFDPETVANAVELSMTFHDHFVNATHIATMVAASTNVGTGDTGGGSLVNVANLVGFFAARYRDTFRMSRLSTLELVLPTWVEDALVADLVARNATTDFANAHARVRNVFESINVRPQFVQDWQSIGDNDNAGWPEAADMLLFAPGTFVRLDGGSLDLGIVRDSTLNATNEFQTFMESFEEVCEIGHDSWLLDGIAICPRGTAAIDATLDCNPGYYS